MADVAQQKPAEVSAEAPAEVPTEVPTEVPAAVPAEAPAKAPDAKVSKQKRSNKVSDASKLPKSDNAEEILKQVEFYFSDENLLNDKFLLDLTKKEGEDGWVPVATIASFSRMRRFSPIEKVVDALRQSKELLEVSEDGTKLRRKVALVEPTEEEIQEALARTVYAKGFGDETPTSQFDIESFFEKFGPVKQVRLRRTPFKKFKGSVFVEFKSLDDAKAFLQKEKVVYGDDKELTTMSEKAYQEMKDDQKKFANEAKGGNKRKLINSYNYDKLHKKVRRVSENAKSAEKPVLKAGDAVPVEAIEEKADEKTESAETADKPADTADASATEAATATAAAPQE